MLNINYGFTSQQPDRKHPTRGDGKRAPSRSAANTNFQTTSQQLPMTQEMQHMHDYHDGSSIADNLLQSTELRRKSNYSPFSTQQRNPLDGSKLDSRDYRSRSNSPHDTSLAASSDRIEKRTKKMKEEIQSID